MTVPFRWPWTPPPEPPDPDQQARAALARLRWHEAVVDLRKALVAADEYVQTEQEDPGGV